MLQATGNHNIVQFARCVHVEMFVLSTDIFTEGKNVQHKVNQCTKLQWNIVKVYLRVLVYICPIEDYAQCFLHLH